MRIVHFSFLLALLALPLATAASIGVSPARIVNDNLLPGSTLQESIVLSKNAEEAVAVLFEVKGTAADWVSHPSEVVVPRDANNFRVPIDIDVPVNTTVGAYSSNINIFVLSESNVQMAFSIPMDLAVIAEEDTSYQVKHVNANQQDGGAVSISFEVHNNGNVPSGPTSATLEVFDVAKSDVLYTTQHSVQKVNPFTITERSLTFRPEISDGDYWVNVTLQGTNNQYEESVFFEFEASEISQPQLNNPQPILSPEHAWFLVLVALVITALILVVMKKRDD